METQIYVTPAVKGLSLYGMLPTNLIKSNRFSDDSLLFSEFYCFPVESDNVDTDWYARKLESLSKYLSANLLFLILFRFGS